MHGTTNDKENKPKAKPEVWTLICMVMSKQNLWWHKFKKKPYSKPATNYVFASLADCQCDDLHACQSDYQMTSHLWWYLPTKSYNKVI